MLALITALVGSGILSVIKKAGDALLHSKYISAQTIFDKLIIDCVHVISPQGIHQDGRQPAGTASRLSDRLHFLHEHHVL